MQKAERMGVENQNTHAEDVTATLLKNLDIHRYDKIPLYFLQMGNFIFCSER